MPHAHPSAPLRAEPHDGSKAAHAYSILAALKAAQ
jgi:hypothetical protein